MFPPFVELKGKDVKTISSTKNGMSLGTRGITQDGRVFRWMLNGGTALSMGIPVVSAALQLLDNDTETWAAINDTEDISTTWRAIKVDTETSTGELAADEYADGYVRVATSTASNAKGQLVRIKSNDASATSSTDALGSTMTITFADDDALSAALDTGAIIRLAHSPYWKVVVMSGGGTTQGIVGIPVRPVTANYYFWGQTWGPCAVEQNGVLVAGVKVIQSTSTAEAISALLPTGATEITATDAGFLAYRRPTIGWAMGSAGTDAYYGLIFLTIAP